MSHLQRATPSLALAAVFALSGVAVAPHSSAQAAVRPDAAAAAQYYGYSWPSGYGYAGPGYANPYAGSPSYPYYRYGSYYGSAFGPPYPVYPSFGAYYGEGYGTQWPAYSSAGGIALGGDYGAGFFAPLGRCVYSALAGVGGSWTDPQSYGYYAPLC